MTRQTRRQLSTGSGMTGLGRAAQRRRRPEQQQQLFSARVPDVSQPANHLPCHQLANDHHLPPRLRQKLYSSSSSFVVLAGLVAVLLAVPLASAVPVFSSGQQRVTRSVSEDVVVGTSVGITFTPTFVGSVSFALEGNAAQFQISAGGAVSTQAALDRESTERYDLVVRATDNEGSATADLIIIVGDVNDNAPTFNASSYAAPVTEESATPTNVITVKATDPDRVLYSEGNLILGNGLVSYAIVAGDPLGQFSINADTGLIRTTTVPIDRESTPTITLTVLASDAGSPSLNSSVQVSVAVTDINDNDPAFDNQAGYAGDVSEDAAPGTHILDVSASDADTGVNAQLSFAILAGPGSTLFAVDAAGAVTTAAGASFDRETTTQYNITLQVTDGGSPQRSDTVFAIITVLDVNDNAPVFTVPGLNVTLAENVSVGHVLDVLAATDADLVGSDNAAVRFTLQDGATPATSFAIDDVSGVLTLAAGLDFESGMHRYEFYAVVNNSLATPPLWTQIPIVVDVTDVNDNTPQLNASSYVAIVAEGSSIGTAVLAAGASDLDSGVNSELQFSLAGSGDEALFSVDPDTGAITTAAVLDREAVGQHAFTVVVTDKGSPARSSSASVTITVSDVNDNTPTFDPSASLAASVSEDAATGTVVINVNATDLDIGSNAELRYSIVAGNTNGAFAVDNVSGVVTVASGLDRETLDGYVLVVRVTDQGSPTTRQADANVSITVTDVNDNDPVFGASSTNQSVSVFENTPAPHAVAVVNATDADIGDNALLVYSIVAGNDDGHFDIDTATGAVSTTAQLDREAIASYRLFVRVRDSGAAVQREATTWLDVTVLDLNDNPPLFGQGSYSASLSEATPVSTVLLNLTSTDADEPGTNTLTQYAITAGNTGGAWSVDTATGQLSVATSLDRETVASCTLTVRAENTNDNTQASTVSVTVTVTDENDNAPVFDAASYSFVVKENTTVQTQVGVVTATDADAGDNGAVSYSIVSGNVGGAFAVSSSTGALTLNNAVDRETLDTYTLTLRAADAGSPQSLTADVVVTITITDVNDNAPVFGAVSYQAQVSEAAPLSFSVLNLSATDADLHQPLLFSIVEGSAVPFSIGTLDGTLSVSAALDRETFDFFAFHVTVTDQGTEFAPTVVSVNVSILDENDNTPQLSTLNLTATLAENTPPGAFVAQASATDADIGPNAQLTFSLSGADAAFFSINASSGRITTALDLDYESRQDLACVVTVSDAGLPTQRSASTSLELTITDENDNTPVIAQHTQRLLENTTVGTLVHQFVATDRDSGLNSELTYLIVAGNTDQFFAMDAATGEVTLETALDRESLALYELTIVVSDAGTPPRNASATLVVIVDDVNDNTPVVSQRNVELFVPEDTGVATVLVNLTSSDPDHADNGVVIFSVQLDNSNGTFALQNHPNGTATLSLATALDRETRTTYELVLRASDQGSPPRFVDVDVSVEVTDVNDNTPIANGFAAALTEEANETVALGCVQASDADEGDNARLSFAIAAVVPGDNTSIFVINATSGCLSAQAPVDRDLGPQTYTITVLVSDNGVLTQRNTTATVDIDVLDINDNAPVLLQVPYVATDVSEATAPGASTVLLTVSASDIDDGNAGQVRFSLSPSASPWFEVDSVTGDVALVSALDYEQAQSHTFSVIATDQGSPPLSSEAAVTVLVSDENDNAPVFVAVNPASPPFVQLAESTAVGTNITSLTATDADSGTNGHVDYIITSGNSKSLFRVSADGILQLASALDFEADRWWNLTVEARDRGSPQSQSNTVQVTVRVLDVNDNNPVFQGVQSKYYLPEVAPNNTEIATLVATDVDTGTVISYAIRIIDPTLQITIDAVTGRLYTTASREWDRDVQPQFSVLVEAFDGPNPATRRSSLQEIVVVITDINDNPPVFVDVAGQPTNTYATEVFGDIPVGATVATVRAVDTDEGINAEVRYALVGPNDAPFDINATTGVVYTTRELSVHQASTWNVTLQAYDLAAVPMMSEPAHLLVDVLALFLRATWLLCPAPQQELPDNWNDTATEELADAVAAAVPGVRPHDVNVLQHRPSTDNPLCIELHVQVLAFSNASALQLALELDEAVAAHTIASNLTGTLLGPVPASPLGTPLLLLLQGADFSPVHLREPPLNRAPVIFSEYAVMKLQRDGPTLVSELLEQCALDYDLGTNVDKVNTNANTLGMAVVQHGQAHGQWEYKTGPGGSWTAFSAGVSAVSAVVLPPSATLRFVTTEPWFHGVDQLVFKAHDNAGQFRTQVDVTTGRWLPFGSHSNLEATALQVVLPLPNAAPVFSGAAPAWLTAIDEDVAPSSNPGAAVDVVVPVSVDAQQPISNLTQKLAQSPPSLLAAIPDAVLTEYATRVDAFNTVSENRKLSLFSGTSGGVGVVHTDNGNGQWQVSSNLVSWATLNVDASSNKTVLVSSQAHLRFVPNTHFHGSAAIELYAWDGVQGQAGTEVPLSLLSGAFSVARLTAYITVQPVNDRPTTASGVATVSLPAIPYAVEQDTSFSAVLDVAADPATLPQTEFADKLSLALEGTVTVLRLQAGSSGRALVTIRLTSFDPSDTTPKTYAYIANLVAAKATVLSSQAFAPYRVVGVQQPQVLLGFNAECGYTPANFSLAGTNPGAKVADLLSAAGASDVDGDAVGIAVTALTSGGHGEWQFRLPSSQWWSGFHEPLLASSSSTSSSPSASSAVVLGPDAWVRFNPTLTAYWSSAVSASDVFLTFVAHDQAPSHSSGAGPVVVSVTVNSPSSRHSSTPLSLLASRTGCDGVEGSAAVLDDCCQCVVPGAPVPACTNGCDGAGGTVDDCGRCGPQTTPCVVGCDNIPFSGLELDDCGVCNGNNAGKDCAGTCFGDAQLDFCTQLCAGGTTGVALNATMDCNGDCNGAAVVDACGSCVEGNTGLTTNYLMDCNNVCNGAFVRDACGVCQNPAAPAVNFTDCRGVCFGPAVFDDCGDCRESVSDPTFNSGKDLCGECYGNNDCVGCDGVPYSTAECDDCNGTLCPLSLTSVTPSAGSLSTRPTVELVGHGFPIDQRDKATCVFTLPKDDGSNPDTVAGFLLPGDFTTRATCRLPVATNPGNYTVQLSFLGRDPTNAVPFEYYDPAQTLVQSISPVSALVGETVEVVVAVSRLPLSNKLSCVVPELSLVVPVVSSSPSHAVCRLPVVTVSQNMTVQISVVGDAGDVLGTTPGASTVFRFIAPAATLQGAVLSAAATEVLISWSHAVESAFHVNVAGCAAFWDDDTVKLLGSSACALRTSKELAIELASDAALLPGSRLFLRANAVFRAGEAQSNPSSGHVRVTGLELSSAPKAVITLPERVPVCGSLVISGALSSGSGHKPLVFRWSLSSSLQSTALRKLSARISALPSSTQQFVLDAQSDLAPGAEYAVRLTVTDAFGRSSTLATAVFQQPTSRSTPEVSIVGPKERTLSGSAPVTLVGAARRSPCANGGDTASGAAAVLEYAWVINRCADTACLAFSNVVTLPANAAQGAELRLKPSLDLLPGGRYLVTLSAYPKSMLSAVAMASVVVNVAHQPLECPIISPGGNRPLSAPLVLDASESNDPDLAGQAGASSGLGFAWTCTQTSGAPCHLAADPTQVLSLTTATTAQLTVAANALLPGEYVFRVRVSKNGRSSSCAATVALSQTPAPAVAARVLLAPSSSSARHGASSATEVDAHPVGAALKLHGEVTSQDAVTAFWSCIGEFCPTLSGTGSSASSPYTFAAGQAQQVAFRIAANTLLPGKRMVFRLHAINAAGNTGFGDVVVSTGVRAANGRLVVSSAATARSALRSEVRLSAVDWTDEPANLPLTYEFTVTVNGAWAIVAQGLGAHVDTVLPEGEVHVTLLVTNAKGTERSVSQTVTVARNPLLDDNSLIASLAQVQGRAKAEGNVPSALSLLGVVLVQSNAVQAFGSGTAFKNGAAELVRDIVPTFGTSVSRLRWLVNVARQLATRGKSGSVSDTWIVELARSVFDATELLLRGDLSTVGRRRERRALPTGGAFVYTPAEALDILSSFDALLGVASPTPLEPRFELLGDTFSGLLNVAEGLLRNLVLGEAPVLLATDSLALRVQHSLVTSTSAIAVCPDCEASFGRSTSSVQFSAADATYFANWPCGGSSSCAGVGFALGESLVDVWTDPIVIAPSGAALQRLSPVVQVQLFNPVDGAKLPATLQGSFLDVKLPHVAGEAVNLVCMSRAAAPSSQSDFAWSSPLPVTVTTTASGTVFGCRPTAFGQFAVFRQLAAPTTTTATTTTATTSTATSSTTTFTTTSTSTATTTTTTTTVTTSTTMSVQSRVDAVNNSSASSDTWIVVPVVLVVVVLLLLLLALVRRRSKQSKRFSITNNIVPLQQMTVPVQFVKIVESGDQLHLGVIEIAPGESLARVRQMLTNKFTAKKQLKTFTYLTPDFEDVEPLKEHVVTVQDIFQGGIYLREITHGPGMEAARRMFCVCGAVAEFECSQCEAQGYCSRKCQEAHWSAHYDECTPVKNSVRHYAKPGAAGARQPTEGRRHSVQAPTHLPAMQPATDQTTEQRGNDSDDDLTALVPGQMPVSETST